MSTPATRFAAIYGSRPLHLLTMVSGLALLGYILVTFSPATLWNPGTWWQSIAVWFAAAVVAHDDRIDGCKRGCEARFDQRETFRCTGVEKYIAHSSSFM